MAKAEHQATWRAKSQRTRVEIYLNPDELARLDSIGGTRAEALRRLLAGAVIPADALDQLRAEFPDQGAAYGVDWPTVTESALTREKHRRRDAERQRRYIERKDKAIGR